jgi:RimJ/RimL family protein N-acetyltransferase
MVIREANVKDAGLFLELLKSLDNETSFMLYEPGERKSTIDDIGLQIQHGLSSSSLLLVVEANDKLIAFLSGDRGFTNRIKHSCYIVIGILKEFNHQGLGTMLFEEMEQWARLNHIVRLELTVMTHNEVAIKLYQKRGFKVEGVKEKSLFMNNQYIDEYYMS